MFWKKKQIVPITNDTKEIEVSKAWIVIWDSVYHYVEGYKGIKKQYAVCLSEEEAKNLKISLENAFKLCRDTSRCVTIEER
jgi:hypothetical protein